jgi:hypothetical protein
MTNTHTPQPTAWIRYESDGVYLGDERGEIVCWVQDEWEQEPSLVPTIVHAAELLLTRGGNALRQRIGHPDTLLAHGPPTLTPIGTVEPPPYMDRGRGRTTGYTDEHGRRWYADYLPDVMPCTFCGKGRRIVKSTDGRMLIACNRCAPAVNDRTAPTVRS